MGVTILGTSCDSCVWEGGGGGRRIEPRLGIWCYCKLGMDVHPRVGDLVRLSWGQIYIIKLAILFDNVGDGRTRIV